jgi:hypothetical protein
MKARVRKKAERRAGKKAGKKNEKRRFLISEIQAEIMPHRCALVTQKVVVNHDFSKAHEMIHVGCKVSDQLLMMGA